ncbi:isochorismatase family protein [Cedecea davisae]|uniref:Isochorismatase family protein n=1 Tax=Cedecea davisae TaxID=158484 RepID=A0ABS6DGW4_9ENTR|nr:isochorismatase family protein [Cedecea davisae]MBU4682315.1 isochorismatase family protein [Cedecea davisae]MBU4688495.1 isochorismatase family protein [Cedecea davisae]
MPASRVVMVIDMQNGVFEFPRRERERTVAKINQLIDAAEQVIFIQHTEAGLEVGSEAYDILPELHRPEGAHYVTKTACDAFYRTGLAGLLEQQNINELAVCGCATDYCVDTTIKNGVSRGYAITVAGDAHTTADRASVSAEMLIRHHNEVWANLSIPGNTLRVKETAEIIDGWR